MSCWPQVSEQSQVLFQRSHPAFSCRDVLQGSDGGLTTRGVAFSALQNDLVEQHHLGVPQPLRPLGLSGHFGQYGQIVVALQRRKKITEPLELRQVGLFFFFISPSLLNLHLATILHSQCGEKWVHPSCFTVTFALYRLLRTQAAQHRKYRLETTTHKVCAVLVRKPGVTALPARRC